MPKKEKKKERRKKKDFAFEYFDSNDLKVKHEIIWFDLACFLGYKKCICTSFSLTYLFPMHPVSVPWNHQKTLRFSNVFSGHRKSALGTNGLKL